MVSKKLEKKYFLRVGIEKIYDLYKIDNLRSKKLVTFLAKSELLILSIC